MRLVLLGLAIAIGCAPTGAPAAPGVGARHPGPCSTIEDGPSGRAIVSYAYDRRQRLVREVERGEGRSVQRLWSYDDAGRRARLLVVEGDRLHAVWYVYDDRGLLVATEEDATGRRDVVLRREREYDERGKLVRMATRAPGGAVREEHVLLYDDAGRLAWEVVAAGPDAVRVEIEVDAAGRIVARRSEGEAQRFVFAATGELMSMTVERDGRPHLERRYAYDGAGNLVRAETRDAAGRPVRTTVHAYGCWQP